MKLLDYVKNVICEYPTLYLFSDFNSSFIRVLDQVCNVLGSGYEWAKTKNPKKGGYLCYPQYFKRGDEYIKKFDNPYGKEELKKDFSLYLNEPVIKISDLKSYKNLFTGPVSEFEKHPNKEEWELNSISFKGNKPYHEGLKYKITYNVIEENLNYLSFFYKKSFDFNCWIPYPSFKKEYSPLWKDEVKYIQEDWKIGALWWLKECKRYFSDNRVKTYHYFPSPNNIEELKKCIKTHLSSGEYKNIQDVNRAYGLNCFTGENFEEFANAYWEKELDEINNFIKDTTAKLLFL